MTSSCMKHHTCNSPCLFLKPIAYYLNVSPNILDDILKANSTRESLIISLLECTVAEFHERLQRLVDFDLLFFLSQHNFLLELIPRSSPKLKCLPSIVSYKICIRRYILQLSKHTKMSQVLGARKRDFSTTILWSI